VKRIRVRVKSPARLGYINKKVSVLNEIFFDLQTVADLVSHIQSGAKNPEFREKSIRALR